MIKWKSILIRLAFLGSFFALIHFGTSPLISWTLRTVVQAVTGSKLEIEGLDASPFQTRLSTGKIQLAHPKKEFQNLVTLKNSEIKLDPASLLRKKFIVTTGSVDGIEFGGARDESGILPPDVPPANSPANEHLSKLGKKAVQGLQGLLQKRFEENFESVNFSRDSIKRWEEEYRQLVLRSQMLEKKVRDFRDLADEFNDNPLNTLRDLPKVEKSLNDASRIRNELDFLRHRLASYRDLIKEDRDKLLAAKNRDLARIHEIKTDRKLNGRSLSQLLVGDVQGQRVDDAIRWIAWLRQTFPHPKKVWTASRSRGQTIRFPGQQDRPDFLVKSLKVSGQGTLEKKSYAFAGTVAGLTTQPEVYGKPAYIQLAATGDIDFTVKGMIDRSQETEHDRIIIDVPSMKVANQELKLDEKLEIQMPRSELKITARIDRIGDQLSGQIKATQSHVNLRLDSTLDNQLAQEFKTLLNQDLETVRQFEVVAKISGTTKNPQWQLHSDLGPQISQAFSQTLTRGYEQKKVELIGKLEKETDESLRKIAVLVDQQESKIVAFLTKQTNELAKLQTKVASLLNPANRLRIR